MTCSWMSASPAGMPGPVPCYRNSSQNFLKILQRGLPFILSFRV